MPARFLSRLILCLSLSWSLPALSLHIMLDPGHGGMDKGAVYGSTVEADLVLRVAQELKVLLERDPRFQVTLTRTKDHNISLPARVEMAEKLKADLFISLHANAADDQRARGVEFFFQNNLPPDEESLFLASQENQILRDGKRPQEILVGEDLSRKGDVAAIIEDLKRQSRIVESLEFTRVLSRVWDHDPKSAPATIKQAPFYVISKTSMPSVLVEIGFLSNPREAKKLQSPEYQSHLAQKIYSAIQHYKQNSGPSFFEVLNKNPAKSSESLAVK